MRLCIEVLTCRVNLGEELRIYGEVGAKLRVVYDSA